MTPASSTSTTSFDLEDGAVLELEPMDEYDDEDALDAAAMALLSGQRLDRLPKGLPRRW